MNTINGMRFKSPEEELHFLRGQVAQMEQQQISNAQEAGFMVPERGSEQIAHQLIQSYASVQPETVLHNTAIISHEQANALSLQLAPEAHDSVIEQLYALMLSTGVHNTLRVVAHMQNPHITDDFHRFLVQYLLATNDLNKASKNDELYKQINVTLFEVTLPEPDGQKNTNNKMHDTKELIATMEQMLTGLQSLAHLEKKTDHWYTLEMCVPVDGTHVSFYIGVPTVVSDLFEKQLFGLYPDARADKVTNDPNIFSETGSIVSAYAETGYEEMTAIKTYSDFDSDPIDVMVQVFSKLSGTGEGALFQIVINPNDNGMTKDFTKKLEELKKGTDFSEVRKKATVWNTAKDMAKMFKSSDDDKEQKYKLENEVATEYIGKKLKSPIVQSTMRLIVSAEQPARAQSVMQEIQSAFHQFTVPYAGAIAWKEVKPNQIEQFTHDAIFRVCNYKHLFHLNLSEVATLFHFPVTIEKASHLKRKMSATAPAPFEIAKEGILLGINEHRGVSTEIFMKPEDRMRHMYVIGQTGVGKTGILMGMIAQNLIAGDGMCFIDPHGNDIQSVLGMVPPERIEDVIYFDPSYLARPMGLNMMEYDPRFPQQKSLIIDQMMQIFNQLFDMKNAGGPLFEQYFKNSAYLVMEHPESGCTLMEIARVMSDKEYRDMKLSHCANPLIRNFWSSAEKTKGDQGLENYVPYITSKFDPLLSNEFLRPIVAQEKSAFNFRELMDNKKILLVNLSKGLLGELNANLLGMILVGKIQMAALSRADDPGKVYADFYLYLDEFQNVTTPAIASILSEARKYRLSLNVAHQYMKQLSDDIKAAVLGNVGSMAIFRIAPEDAKELAPYFLPTFQESDIIKLENMNAYIKMLADGKPLVPFNIKTINWKTFVHEGRADAIKQISYLRYCRDRAEVEAEIVAKYNAGNKR